MSARDLARIAVFAALTAGMGLLGSFTVAGAVPITLQTLGGMLAGAVLGPWRGAASMALLLLGVAIGLPLLAAARGRIRVVASPAFWWCISLVFRFRPGSPSCPSPRPLLPRWYFCPATYSKWSSPPWLPWGSIGPTHEHLIQPNMPQNNLQLTPVHNPDAEAALTAALNIRAAGGVPLIIDPRAPVSTCALEAALPDNAAWAVLTSGTTGAPKIVVRSQDSWQVAFSPLNTQLGLQPGDGIWLPV